MFAASDGYTVSYGGSCAFSLVERNVWDRFGSKRGHSLSVKAVAFYKPIETDEGDRLHFGNEQLLAAKLRG